MDGVKRARGNWTEKGRKREGRNGGKIFVSRALVYSPLSLIANNFGFPDQPATSGEGNSAMAVILIRWTGRVNLTESCIANNVGLIQFAVTVIVLHSWESMYSKQREYAILLVTSDFIRVTNFIYPGMVIRFLVDESKGKRENKGNENTRIHRDASRVVPTNFVFEKSIGQDSQQWLLSFASAPLPLPCSLFFFLSSRQTNEKPVWNFLRARKERKEGDKRENKRKKRAATRPRRGGGGGRGLCEQEN